MISLDAQAEHVELQTYLGAVTASSHEAQAETETQRMQHETQQMQHETQRWQVCLLALVC